MSVPMNILAQSELCRGFTESEIRTIHALSEEVEAPSGATLFCEGDAGDGIYLVTSGELVVLKRARDGQERELARVGVGAVLGEMSLVQSGARRSATVRAVDAASLLRVPAAKFESLLGQDAVEALKVVRNLARVLSQRIAKLDEKIIGLLGREGPSRHAELDDFQKVLQSWSF